VGGGFGFQGEDLRGGGWEKRRGKNDLTLITTSSGKKVARLKNKQRMKGKID